jgi:hypothetical protein
MSRQQIKDKLQCAVLAAIIALTATGGTACALTASSVDLAFCDIVDGAEVCVDVSVAIDDVDAASRLMRGDVPSRAESSTPVVEPSATLPAASPESLPVDGGADGEPATGEGWDDFLQGLDMGKNIAIEVEDALLRIVSDETEEQLSYFDFEHLPPQLAEVSKPFHDLAHQVAANDPWNRQTGVALDHLLMAKDAAVRAHLPCACPDCKAMDAMVFAVDELPSAAEMLAYAEFLAQDPEPEPFEPPF